jgi:hypothetical protein
MNLKGVGLPMMVLLLLPNWQFAPWPLSLFHFHGLGYDAGVWLGKCEGLLL